MIVYKIRRTTDGLFSKGGEKPFFDTKGKLWKARNHVTSHMTQLGDNKKSFFYKDCEVVSFEIVETEFEKIHALEWKETDKTSRKKEIEKEQRKMREEERLKNRKLELEAELLSINKKSS